MNKLKVVHYINQFYAGIGGEDKADYMPELREGAIGPGTAFAAGYGEQAEITHTIVCGDSYFNEHTEEAVKTILAIIHLCKPDLFLAGPAFNAGRYGVACATICDAVRQVYDIPVLTGMYKENPGADMYKDMLLITATGGSAASMREAIAKMIPLSLKLARGDAIGASAEEGYLPNGVRVNFFEKERGSKRAVDMLLKKMAGKDFETEYPMPDYDRVPPNPAVIDLSKAKIALVTSGGIVPKGNPDHIESSSASKYGEYSIEGLRGLSADTHETAHGGYDPLYANQDANRVLPVDIMREFEAQGLIGKLHNTYYATVGNGTAVKSAKAYAAEFSQKLRADGVEAVILTST